VRENGGKTEGLKLPSVLLKGKIALSRSSFSQITRRFAEKNLGSIVQFLTRSIFLMNIRKVS